MIAFTMKSTKVQTPPALIFGRARVRKPLRMRKYTEANTEIRTAVCTTLDARCRTSFQVVLDPPLAFKETSAVGKRTYESL